MTEQMITKLRSHAEICSIFGDQDEAGIFHNIADHISAQEARITALTKDAEPIYQWKAPYSGAWRDISKDAYLEIKGYIHNITGNGEVRVVYTHPPAPKAITSEDADIEYWRQKYLKLDAMYDELEKEKISIEQNLMDRT